MYELKVECTTHRSHCACAEGKYVSKYIKYISKIYTYTSCSRGGEVVLRGDAGGSRVDV